MVLLYCGDGFSSAQVLKCSNVILISICVFVVSRTECVSAKMRLSSVTLRLVIGQIMWHRNRSESPYITTGSIIFGQTMAADMRPPQPIKSSQIKSDEIKCAITNGPFHLLLFIK